MSNVYDLTGVINLDNQYLRNIGNAAVTESGTGAAADLQSTLNTINTNLRNVQAASLQTVTQQAVMQRIVNTENQRLANKASAVNDALSSKRRAIELNESYRKKQQYYTYILLVIILAAALCVVAFMFLPESIKDLTLILIIAVAIIVIMRFLYVIGMRDTTNFDKLHSISPVSPATTKSNQQNKKTGGQLLPTIQCMGSDCCPSGSRYSTILNQCVFIPTPPPDASKIYEPTSRTFVDTCPGATATDDSTLGYKVCVAQQGFSTMGTASSAQPYTPFEFNSYSRL